jgi:hypothetical protein
MKLSEPPWYISLAHQFDMVDVGRAVGPLVGARQRAVALPRIEGYGMARRAVVERRIHGLQAGSHGTPVVERGLQRPGDACHGLATRQVAADHHQAAIAATRLERRQLHGRPQCL